MQAFYSDPHLYDALFPAGPGEGFLDFYLSEARTRCGAVLELARGTGAVLEPLALAGLRIVGLDLSQPMLDRARTRLASTGASLIHADMRSFYLRERFPLIICAHNSLCELHAADDLLACFRCVRKHLRPGGAFIFDIFNPDLTILARPTGARFAETTIDHPVHGQITVESEGTYDAAAQVRRETWHFSSRVKSWTAPLAMRSIFPQELPLLLAAAGLQLDVRYGDFARGPFKSDSPHQVCICSPTL